MGGLRVASAAVGAHPDVLFNNVRRAKDAKVEDARTYIATELNARNWNPKWISEMQKEGYAGARTMTNSVEYLYGWQATAPETLSPTVWQKTYDVYVADEYKLGLHQFFETSNPAAKQVLVARLLEVDRQGTYRFAPNERAQLVQEYVRLVSKFGVACSANVCGNPRLQSVVFAEAQKMSNAEVAPADLQRFQKLFREAAAPNRPLINPPDAARRNARRTDVLTPRNIRFVDLVNFKSAKRAVTDNPLLVLGLSLGILTLAVFVACGKRRPLNWSELRLATAAGSRSSNQPR
jgi:cobaltochelatase CobN